MKSLPTLLSNVFDYAGLFPPAKLEMQQAVQNYSDYLMGEYSWMLGKFIVPLSRLGEFERSLENISLSLNAIPWSLAVLASTSLSNDISVIRAFNARRVEQSTCRSYIETIELIGKTAGEISTFGGAVAANTTYVEIPIKADHAPLVDVIGHIGARAKIRTGGISGDLFPSSADLARFIVTCVRAGVPFKATAGLHHPVRACYRLTYDANSPSAMMYGFLNLLLAAAFVAAGMNHEDTCRVLEEEDVHSFQFDQDGVTWKNHRLSIEAIRKARKTVVISIGSCSFTEPVDELKRLRLL